MSDAAYKVNPWHLAGHYAVLKDMVVRDLFARSFADHQFWERAYLRQIDALSAFKRGEE